MSDAAEREELIHWLVANLPGGPEAWIDNVLRLTKEFHEYSTPALIELKAYAKAQIAIHAVEKQNFERLLDELKRR